MDRLSFMTDKHGRVRCLKHGYHNCLYVIPSKDITTQEMKTLGLIVRSENLRFAAWSNDHHLFTRFRGRIGKLPESVTGKKGERWRFTTPTGETIQRHTLEGLFIYLQEQPKPLPGVN